MAAPFGKDGFATFLAPMQDITELGFLNAVCKRGAPDFCIAEYFRIHEYYELESFILDAILNSPLTDRVAAQFIGEDEFHMRRAAIEILQKYPQIKMLDLNIGCPAPKIYRKNVGGGLLRNPEKIASIARTLREVWPHCFSVKMRLGFENSDNFDELLDAVSAGNPDFITIHARTVKQLYRGACDYSKIASAVRRLKIPVIANGDISSARKALEVAAECGCAGVMCGRGAVRNPWIFRQICELRVGKSAFVPTLGDVREYVEDLLRNAVYETSRHADSRMKKFLNFVGVGVDSDGKFLYQMRRARGIDELMKVCDQHLVSDGNSSKPFALDAYPNLCARPNHEDCPTV